MSTDPISPDMTDPTRCISVHWSLPVQCVLKASHRENWHETWHPETGNRLRYRWPGRYTEELRNNAWHDLGLPMPDLRTREDLLAELDRLTPQTCPAGVHADWAVDSGNAHACPWCEVGRLAAEVERLKTRDCTCYPNSYDHSKMCPQYYSNREAAGSDD